jgi:hypothetical protein
MGRRPRPVEIADCGLTRPPIRKITTLKEKWPEGIHTFRPFDFAIANCNPQSAILASSVILWSDHCGADRVTARASVISNLY